MPGDGFSQMDYPVFLLQSFHGQTDAVAPSVYFQNLHLNMLMEMDHFVGIANETVGKLRHMHQSILVNAYVHKCSEVRNVRS